MSKRSVFDPRLHSCTYTLRNPIRLSARTHGFLGYVLDGWLNVVCEALFNFRSKLSNALRCRVGACFGISMDTDSHSGNCS